MASGSRARSGHGAVRVLVVDDSLTMRVTLSHLLSGLGMQVVEVGSGVEALEQLAVGRFRIVFLDWHMPGMSGLELARRIRSDGNWDDVQLIMVTSECEGTNIATALAAGVDEYVTKPFDRQVFESKLAGLNLLPDPTV